MKRLFHEDNCSDEGFSTRQGLFKAFLLRWFIEGCRDVREVECSVALSCRTIENPWKIERGVVALAALVLVSIVVEGFDKASLEDA